MSNFGFLRAGWPAIEAEARRAETYTNLDPRSSLFYARRTLELMVGWLYTADRTLTPPYKDDLSARLYEPTFKRLVGPAVLTKMDIIRKQGNNAVHRTAPIRPTDSLPVVRELFQVMVWVATRYASTAEERPAPGIPFDAAALPVPQAGAVARTLAQLQKLEADLEASDAKLAEERARSEQLEAQVRELQEQVAAWKAANEVVPDTHDYREDETRDLFIDLLLREAGWALDQPRDREFPVTGMPGGSAGGGGNGFVDYVLWGENGLPLGLVEAKRTRKDALNGQQQAKLYADRLEAQFGQRPVIFATNGYEHWIWDDASYAPRRVQGFYTRDQLELLIQRRTTRMPLASLPVSETIVDRHYQVRAVRRVGEAFEHQERRALLVMATGSGKTRTVIALSDLLIRANWAKRVLFLADRKALVKQARNAFSALLPDSAPVNLLDDRDSEGRVYLSTYPTMMGLINQGSDGLRRFGPGYFDLIIVDEAHRSIYQKYGAIFDHFDALLVGLTATPKDEIDRNTYGLFGLEDGVPTDAYDLTEAIGEGYLVPPIGRSITTKFVREGIRYDDLSEDEKQQWELLDWEDGVVPTEVDASAVHSWLFNNDTVDSVLDVLMTEGRKVAGGDRLGKTIIFARNNRHAEFIAERFNANYPEYKGEFARVITHAVAFNQTLIDAFSVSDSAPHIAISVDMLDTGIDVPEVVNLVFFKPVHSKTKYWQMVGRGTRLRPDLYGPGEDKKDFVIFDVCQNIEYFNQTGLPELGGAAGPSLKSTLFASRVRLLAAIDGAAPDTELTGLREILAARLHEQVQGMSLDNVQVRPHRRLVERFSEGSRWLDLSPDDFEAVVELGDLPSAVDPLDTDERARRFDLLALRAQLGVLAGEPGLAAVTERIRELARALASQRGIPVIASNAALLDAVASEEWWTDVTVPMLEMMRIRMRELVRLIDPGQQVILYTDFADSAEGSESVPVTRVAQGVGRARFREKALAFLRGHENDTVLFKVTHGKQLTSDDLVELERLLLGSAGLDAVDVEQAALEASGLGLFVRSLLGLDREAATEALSEFTAGSTFTGNQLTFVNLLVEQLTQRGAVDPKLLFEAPFTDLAPTGPGDLFSEAQVTSLVEALKRVRSSAEAS